MENRTAFITGASSGIGRALALRLAAGGVEVALAARRAEMLSNLAAEISASGGKARVYPFDVGDPEATVAALTRADQEMGGLDLVVANAGVGTQRWAGKLTWQDVKPTLAVNVTGAAATLTALLPRMVERKRGHLVGVSSLAQYRALPQAATYSASKAFLSTFLEGLRMDLSGTGVAVTDVRPGFVRTAMTAPNKFPMPFLLEVDQAADIIARAIKEREPLCEFPWQMAAVMRSTRLLPASLYARAAARMKSKGNGRSRPEQGGAES